MEKSRIPGRGWVVGLETLSQILEVRNIIVIVAVYTMWEVVGRM